jgi:hypothetical protein
LERDEWNGAVRCLFDEEYVFVLTAPREHVDWHSDALAVLKREVEDPRGWHSQDLDSRQRIEDPEVGAEFPFVSPTLESLRTRLWPVGLDAAAQLLVAMKDDWLEVRNITDFDARKEDLLSASRLLLARYGSSPECFTNASVARVREDPNFFAGTSGCSPFTEWTMDWGLVVVSEAEVGVFWRFNGD